jgi:LysR family glycine cleavage system transcriptional activator
VLPQTLPSMSRLKAFEAAARHLSFKLAADELNVTHSAVSHQISGLEAALGKRLFRRLPKRIELTDAGALYLPFVRDAFDLIDQGALALGSRSASDITVQVYVTVAIRWLIPQLQRFRTSHPDISIRLDASSLDWEFNPDQADVGLIYTASPNRPNVDYALLRAESLVAVCSPAVAAGLDDLAMLEDRALLRVFTAPEDWPVWLAATGLPHLVDKAGPTFDSYLLGIEAAVNGQGVIVAPEFLVTRDLRGGRLVQPFAIAAAQPGSWYVTALKRRSAERGIRIFRDWLLNQRDSLD